MIRNSFFLKRSRPWLFACTLMLWQPSKSIATEYGQISTTAETLESFFARISQKYKVHFVYDASEINKNTVVNIKETADIDGTLKQLSSFGISYKIVEGTVILKKIPKQQPKKVTVKGKVITKSEAAGEETLPAVSVREKETNITTLTNIDGEFTITVNENAILVFSMIGFKTKEIAVNGRTSFNVNLEEDINALKEVIVDGYMTISKKLYTGSAVSISGAQIKQEGITDISRMLEGQVAGVSVQNVSGTFGAAPKIRIRGVTSISGDNKPLVVIDNIIQEDVINVSNDVLSSGNALTLLGSSLAGVNADDIEDINILRDAAATARYGARAMNGVLVITTKKGRVGKPLITYSGNFSTTLKPSYNSLNVMNSRDQMAVYQSLQDKYNLEYSSAMYRGTGGIFTKMAQLINTPDENGNYAVENTPEGRAAFLSRYAQANTDWFDLLFKNSFVQEHQFAVSSGNEKAQHRFSGSFLNDGGWTIADNVKRYTANMRSNYTLSNKFTLGMILNGSVREQRSPGANDRITNLVQGVYTRSFDINPYSYAISTSRAMTAYDENGDLEYFTLNYAPFNILNELENNYMKINQLDFKAQGDIGYKITKGLEYNVLGALRYVKTGREHIVTEDANMAKSYRAADNSQIRSANRNLYNDPDAPEITENEIILPQGGFYNRTEDYMTNYNVRHTLTYNTTINTNHTINAFVGQEIKDTYRQNAFNKGYGYQYNKAGVPFISYKAIKRDLESNTYYYGMSYENDHYLAFFSNASYAFKEKYIINGTLRYDGSNKMGGAKNARWLPTWTISGAWNIDQEKFLMNSETIDFLKLRASYGLTASTGSARNSLIVLNNDNTPRPYMSEIESRTFISQLPNTELTWEKRHEGNIGVDIGLNKGALMLSLDVYKGNSFDLIGSVQTSGIGGQSSKTANYADLKSHGVDFSVEGRIIKTQNLMWRSKLVFSYNENTIVNMQNIPRVIDLVRPEGGAKEGYPVRGLYSMVFTGLDHDTGLPLVVGVNGLPTLDVNAQGTNTSFLKYEGSVDPIVTGGFSNTFEYKRFSLVFLVSYQAGNKVRLRNAFSAGYDDFSAMPVEFLNRWQMPGDEAYTNIPVLVDDRLAFSGYPYVNYNYSDIRTVDGSFVRLKNASLHYRAPEKFTKRLGINNLSAGLNATNLWLIYSDKRLNGQDPEFFNAGGVASPLAPQMTLTLRIGI